MLSLLIIEIGQNSTQMITLKVRLYSSVVLSGALCSLAVNRISFSTCVRAITLKTVRLPPLWQDISSIETKDSFPLQDLIVRMNQSIHDGSTAVCLLRDCLQMTDLVPAWCLRGLHQQQKQHTPICHCLVVALAAFWLFQSPRPLLHFPWAAPFWTETPSP